MTAAWELHRGLLARGVRSAFVATGQTGILLAGRGLAIDRVIADFTAGAAEALVLEAAAGHDVVVVEGQGSLLHPGYAGVTLSLLHGALPHSMILCHQATRTRIRHGDVAIPPLADLVRRYEDALAPLRPGRVVAAAIATFDLEDDEARFALEGQAKALALPVTDPVRHGAGLLVEAVLAAREESVA
jgi:uncharacterized NAD-dependent epimerase/dehydratase family protein